MTNSLRTKRLSAIENQINRLEARLARLYGQSGRYAQIRFALFVGGVLLAGLVWWGSRLWWPAAAVLAIFWAGFVVAVVAHGRVERAILKFQIWQQLKKTQLAQMRLDWAAMPSATVGRTPGQHPFGRDLDLTGEYSLHRLLDSCVSREGSERLRDWLLDPQPDLAQILRRQELVRILAPLHHFRHKLTLSGMLASTGSGGWWDGPRLREWLAGEAADHSLRFILFLTWLLAPLNLLLFAWATVAKMPPYWIPSLVIYAALTLLKWRETAALFNNALILQQGLKKLEEVFAHLERFPLARYAPLAKLCGPFLEPARRPSRKLKQVSRLVIAAGLAQNPVIALLLNLIMPWNLFWAHRLSRYKRDLAQHLPQWTEVWFELEALSALAGFAYLNPDYTFPQIMAYDPQATNGADRPLFQAERLGHPLIPQSEKVQNDFIIAEPGQVGLITGSNMAGKSSFLRTVGVNLCLAYAGGPVDAAVFRTNLLRLFSCLNVSDSVTDGISYFYAEVKRLKWLLAELEAADGPPLLYLIDEIFRGTNNRERYIGSRSYIRTLVGQAGAGLIATHDLELVKLADELDQIKNYHFREEVVAGRMAFDYRLRPGPCPTTNALEIMRLEGLPVEER